jgi:hypothetical protein
MNRNSKGGWLLFGLAGLALVLIPQMAQAERLGGCIRADVPAPIVLPDGRVEQAGELKICLTQLYSPVSGLHKTSINGRAVGIFVSSRETERKAGRQDTGPYFVFRKNGGEEYELLAYAWRDGNRVVTYTVGGGRVRSYWTAKRNRRLSEPSINNDDDSLILLAANLR